MEITKCDYNSLKYAQRNRDDDRYGNHGKEMCKLFLFFPLFSYMSLHIHCIRVMNWSNLKKKPNKIIKEHSQHESETYSRFIFFSHSFLFKTLFSFSRVFLELNQTLIVGYQVTRVAWLSSLFCARIMFLIFFGGGGGGVHIITLLQTKSL